MHFSIYMRGGSVLLTEIPLPRIARQGTVSLISIRGQARTTRIEQFEFDEGFRPFHRTSSYNQDYHETYHYYYHYYYYYCYYYYYYCYPPSDLQVLYHTIIIHILSYGIILSCYYNITTIITILLSSLSLLHYTILLSL